MPPESIMDNISEIEIDVLEHDSHKPHTFVTNEHNHHKKHHKTATQGHRDVPIENVLSSTPPSTKMTTRLKDLSLVPDRLLLRLNKLFASAEDLSAVFSTFYYLIRIIRMFRSEALSIMDKVPELDTESDFMEFSPMATLLARSGDQLWNTRMTLRLVRFLPIYTRFRQTIAARQVGDDKVMFATSLLQCSLHGASQLLENVAFLSEQGILPWQWMRKLTRGRELGSSSLYTYAYRLWFLAVTCDLLHMMRKVHLVWHSGFEQQPTINGAVHESEPILGKKSEAYRWSQFESLLPLVWLPAGWQISAWLEQSHPGINTRIHDATFVLADFERASHLWRTVAAS